jgi:hypothetical protein
MSGLLALGVDWLADWKTEAGEEGAALLKVYGK